MAADAKNERRKVLDQSQVLGEAFDEDVLSDIEKRLTSDEVKTAAPAGAGDKVELDKADLILGGLDKKLPPEPEVKVDLADDKSADESTEILTEGGVDADKKKKLLLGAAAILVVVLMGVGVGFWFSSGDKEPEKKPEELLKPWQFRAPMPNADALLRVDLQPFIVPLMKSDRGLILNLKVSLEAMGPTEKDLLGEKVIICRDVIYRLLRDRPAQEIATPRAKKLLQAQIKTEINHVLQWDAVYQVYFTSFVITG